MITRLLVLLVVLCALPAAAQAQAQRRGVPQEAAEPLREALKLLETIRVSNLDASWRANAFARLARVLARLGDAEAARTMSNSALAAIDEPVKTPPPAAISPGVIYALLVQTHADLHDGEIAQKLAERGFAVLQTLPDAATRANLMPYMAMGLAEIGNLAGARVAALEGLRAATQVPPGRDQIAALAQVTMAQAKIGDHANALETLAIARQAAAQIPDVTGQVYALAHLARAEAAVGNYDRARTLARDSAMTYDRTQTDSNFTIALRVTTLGLIAVAQAEAKDRNAAHQTMRTLHLTVAQLVQTYERFQALVTEVDTIVQVEKVI
jgi:tetratricopeptide (TPR) repeat protein